MTLVFENHVPQISLNIYKTIEWGQLLFYTKKRNLFKDTKYYWDIVGVSEGKLFILIRRHSLDNISMWSKSFLLLSYNT